MASPVSCLIFLVQDALSFFLYSGKGEEQSLAATVLTLLCLQMGSGSEGEEVFRSLKPLLISILTDSTASPVARQSVSNFFFVLLKASFAARGNICRRVILPGVFFIARSDSSK